MATIENVEILEFNDGPSNAISLTAFEVMIFK